MKLKKAIAIIICFTLVCTVLTVQSEVSAASSYESIDSITLKESPTSIGEGWTLDSSYSSNPPYAYAKGNGEYIAVGPYGSVMRSTDGRNWKALSKFGNYQLTTIAWDGTKYVMFGANTEYENAANHATSEAFISTDGLQWKRVNFDLGEAIHYLVWGNNKFVAVGREHVFTSSDGENWTQTLTLEVQYGSHPIQYVNDTYFIYGYEEKKVYTSKDGLKWTGKALDSKASINDMVWVKDHYLGVGNGIYTSKDGVSWTKQSKSPANVRLSSIVTNGKVYITVGTDESNKNWSYTSTDGVTWKKYDPSNLQVNIYAMYPVDGGFAGIGSNKLQSQIADGTYAIYTKDGINWSYKLAGTSMGGDFGGIATNGKRTVAVGLQASIVYTDNGVNWHSANPFTSDERIGRTNLFDVAWGANKFVAVGNGGVYVSSNGISWKKAKVSFSSEYGSLRDILWTGKFFVASDQVNGVYTSKDGLSWTKVNSVSDNWLTSMVWDGERVIATFQVYNNGNQYTKIMQTKNGRDWSMLAKLDVIVAELGWNGERYIAYYPYNSSIMWISKDGKQWSKANVNLDDNDRFEFVKSFDGYFFAFNDSLQEVNGDYTTYNAYYTSKDGLQWKEVAIPDKYSGQEIFGNEMMLDGIEAYGKYIFVGAYGQIMYTDELQLGI
ncbi:hypothetical protein [Paenibacillus crassostreae]|uniref:Photosynthesis system II assembly factor Ycf48/Hcf136-like domain-containing protein n=1 Tax=Paenibacillus crassostreae TaxID=1763538 RepID=A0A167BBY8_9BACL|nr:hypothetical protein [Paenibacillus crassostreae]AOZ92982.1 hypothetical protein LPB68_12670 [Paenibacillus crassostreae]OAB71929.1 hypothetical protein PNBC_18220 [Paenibacillus crassostreae]